MPRSLPERNRDLPPRQLGLCPGFWTPPLWGGQYSGRRPRPGCAIHLSRKVAGGDQSSHVEMPLTDQRNLVFAMRAGDWFFDRRLSYLSGKDAARTANLLGSSRLLAGIFESLRRDGDLAPRPFRGKMDECRCAAKAQLTLYVLPMCFYGLKT